MDIQTRKIEFVQESLKLQNEELIARFENLLRTSKSKSDELNTRMDRSIVDSENGRLTTSNDLISEIERWV